VGVGTVRWVGREAGREGRSVGTNVPGVPGNDGRLAADAQVGLRCEISRDATRSDARRGRPTRAPTYLRGGRFASSVSVRRRRRDRCFGGGHRVPSLASSRDVRSAASDARSVPTRRARDCAKNAPERRVTASEPVPRLVPWSDGAGCFCSERRFESRVANASVSVARRDERVVGVGNASSAKTSPGTSERCRRAIARVVRGGERFRFRRRRFDRESAASNRSRRASIGHLLSNDAINRAHERASGNRPVYPLVLASSGDRESVVVARAPRVPHILARAPDASRANGRAPTDRRRSPRRPARDGAAGREARHVQRAHEGRARGPPPRPDRGQRHAHGRGQGGGRGRDQQRGHPRGTHLRPFRITPSLASIDRAPLRRTRRERARSSRRPRPALRLKRPHWLGRATVARALSSSASLASPFARRRDLTPPLPSTHRPPDPFASSPFIPAPPLTPRLRLSFLSPRWRGTAARRR
jgi:hypothetical protein